MNQNPPEFPPGPPPSPGAPGAPPVRPPGGSPPQQVSKSGMAIASLVLGILGLCGGILAVLALIFGIIAKKQIAEDPLKEGDGLATAGIVLGIIGIVIWVGYVVLVLASGG